MAEAKKSKFVNNILSNENVKERRAKQVAERAKFAQDKIINELKEEKFKLESQIEELDKLLTAYEFYEYQKILRNDDINSRDLQEKQRKIGVEIESKRQEIEVLRA